MACKLDKCTKINVDAGYCAMHYKRVQLRGSPNKRIRTEHGERKRNTPEYRAWSCMKSRCYDKRNRRYPRYGARGIFVCEDWKWSYPKFLEDMGRRPTSKHQLDRIDNDGNYEPDNCRWATSKEQANNRSTNINIEFMGKKLNLKEWAKELDMNYLTLYRRVRLNEWPIERALTEKVRTTKH